VRKDAAVTWTSPAPTPPAGPLTDGPLTGEDRPILEGYLALQRTTLLRVCAGLTGEQLAARPVPPSTLSLLGLIRHLAKVERIWLRQRAGGQDVPPLHGGPGDDTDFDQVDPALAEQEVQALREEWRLADEAVATVPFTHEFDFRGDPMSLRMVYVHLVGEYSRHNGHADLLRQALDGVTGR
jgi:uncharacterized damage-inducible protein DinB